MGGTVTLSVTAEGNPSPVYQWRTNGVPIPGATAATYARYQVRPSDSSNYDVVVTNYYDR